MTRSAPPFSVQCPSCESAFSIDPGKVPEDGIPAICSTCLRVFPVRVPEGHIESWKESASEIDVDLGVPFAEAAVETAEVAEESDAVEVEPEIHAREAEDIVVEPELVDPVTEEGIVEPELAELSVEEGVLESDVDDTVAEEVLTEPDEAPTTGEAPPDDIAEPPSTPVVEAPFEDLRSLASEALAEEEGDAEGQDTPPEDGGEAPARSVASGVERFGRRDPQERARHLARVLVSDIIAYYPERYRDAFEAGTLQEDFRSEVEKSWKEYVDQVGLEMAESTPYFTEALNEVLGKGRHIF